MNVTIQSTGRRHYLVGDTYPIKSTIRSAGCKWDPERGAWWTGKREVAESIVSGLQSGAVTVFCSWVKLPEGFGVRVPAGVNAASGSTVSVQSREGGTKDVELAALISSNPDGSRVFAVPPRKRAASGGNSDNRRRGSGRCRGCGGSVVDCSHHRAMQGYCGDCAFDEFDC